MIFSLLVAFIVTPWASMHLLKHKKHGEGNGHKHREDWSTRLYRRIMTPLIEAPFWRWIFLAGVLVLLFASCALIAVG